MAGLIAAASWETFWDTRARGGELSGAIGPAVRGTERACWDALRCRVGPLGEHGKAGLA